MWPVSASFTVTRRTRSTMSSGEASAHSFLLNTLSMQARIARGQICRQRACDLAWILYITWRLTAHRIIWPNHVCKLGEGGTESSRSRLADCLRKIHSPCWRWSNDIFVYCDIEPLAKKSTCRLFSELCGHVDMAYVGYH